MMCVKLQKYKMTPARVAQGQSSQAGEASWPILHAPWLRCLSLDKEGEQRGELPHIERGRGDFVISVSACVKNPQP
jgi:hypothetical protein